MNKKTLHIRVGVLFIIMLIFVGYAQPVYAKEQNKQVVKVAYFEMGDYYQEISPGNVRSYDTEFLSKVESYSNLKFEYVNCGTWADALTMLEQNKVDLVGTVQWSQEREDEYEFTLESYGFTVGELATLPDKDFIYEDYKHIGKSVIGCTKNYIRMNEMNDVFKTHGISPTIKTYDNQSELEDALESGEIDIVAANSHTLKTGWTVVEKFSYTPFYFISHEGNLDLMKQLDNAIIKLNLREPSADDELMKQYFPDIMGAPLTREELGLIAENNSYDVYFDANTKPTSWYDEKTGEMKGALVEVCRQITEKTGLKLNPLPRYMDSTELSDSDGRTTTLFNGVIEDLSDHPETTDALINEAFNLYYRSDNHIDLSQDKYSIAIVTQRIQLKKYITEQYPNANIQEYATPLDCIKSVENGDCDLTYLDCRIAENAILENGISDVREFPIDETHQGMALTFPGEDGALIASIVNKGLTQVDQDRVSDLFVEYALEAKEPFTWNTLVREHFGTVIFIFIFILVMFIGMTALFTYAKTMKKEKDNIEKADADRSEFFARMSHDMRTPMNGILGMIQLSIDSNSMSEMKEDMVKARSAGEYMLSLINDTLDLQRLESEKLELKKEIANVKEYYEGIFSILKISAEQKELDFKVQYIDIDMNNYIELDKVRVKQVLSNLISNAIKFTPSGGAIEVTVESLGQDEFVLHRKYIVKDTGIGMSDEFIRNRLFKPYAQENNALSSKRTGSGLGMAITKNLVEIMGGRLEVESAIGEGTTFTVYLDIKRATKEEIDKAEAKKKEKTKAVLSNLKGKKILLCEDHPLNAEITKKLLGKPGCIVTWAENGQLGVEQFKKSDENSFDAILMDIRMPVMDGIAATKAIRKLERADAKVVPIIAMTANAYESDIQNCMDAGMNAHMAKPVKPQQLYESLDKWINKNDFVADDSKLSGNSSI